MTNQAKNKPVRLIRTPELLEKIGYSRSSLWRFLQDKDSGFPRPRMINGKSKAWIESEVDEWILGLETV